MSHHVDEMASSIVMRLALELSAQKQVVDQQTTLMTIKVLSQRVLHHDAMSSTPSQTAKLPQLVLNCQRALHHFAAYPPARDLLLDQLLPQPVTLLTIVTVSDLVVALLTRLQPPASSGNASFPSADVAPSIQLLATILEENNGRQVATEEAIGLVNALVHWASRSSGALAADATRCLRLMTSTQPMARHRLQQIVARDQELQRLLRDRPSLQQVVHGSEAT